MRAKSPPKRGEHAEDDAMASTMAARRLSVVASEGFVRGGQPARVCCQVQRRGEAREDKLGR